MDLSSILVACIQLSLTKNRHQVSPLHIGTTSSFQSLLYLSWNGTLSTYNSITLHHKRYLNNLVNFDTLEDSKSLLSALTQQPEVDHGQPSGSRLRAKLTRDSMLGAKMFPTASNPGFQDLV